MEVNESVVLTQQAEELGLLHSVDIRLRIFRENLMMFVHFVVYYIGLKILLGFLLGLGNGSIL